MLFEEVPELGPHPTGHYTHALGNPRLFTTLIKVYSDRENKQNLNQLQKSSFSSAPVVLIPVHFLADMYRQLDMLISQDSTCLARLYMPYCMGS